MPLDNLIMAGYDTAMQRASKELSQARAALGPVTDEEWGSLKSSGIWGHTRDLIDAVLAKRRRHA